jgi:hypothetical protein
VLCDCFLDERYRCIVSLCVSDVFTCHYCMMTSPCGLPVLYFLVLLFLPFPRLLQLFPLLFLLLYSLRSHVSYDYVLHFITLIIYLISPVHHPDLCSMLYAQIYTETYEEFGGNGERGKRFLAHHHCAASPTLLCCCNVWFQCHMHGVHPAVLSIHFI